jgi:diguanylate cyclase (GGDEF)-like protein
VRPDPDPIDVLAVGADVPDVAGAAMERADDLLGALARLADGGIDVVVLSPELPDGQGGDAIRAVRERADVPIVALAAPDADDALRAGATDVVPASGDEEMVTRAVRYAVALHAMRAEMHRREIVDEDTGLYNARGFEEFATHHVALADRSKQPLVLLSVRIDGRDEVSGEPVGPLAGTAEVLRGAVRDCDVLARLGPSSFVVLLTGDARGAEVQVLSRLVDAVAVSNARAGRTGSLSLSVGSATYDPAEPRGIAELLAEAERGAGGSEGRV